MPGNTTFFIKAADKKITWRDIFSDIFKKHNKEDTARLFMAGTALTTPHESRMLSEWRKPWVFARIGLGAFVFIAVMYILMLVGGPALMMIPTAFVGATVVPLVVLLMIWELNIPRNIPIYSVAGMFFIGGGLSLVFTFMFEAFNTMAGAQWAAATEEPAKLAALCIFLYKPKYKYTLNGILIGSAIGCGFAAFETMAYFLNHGYANLWVRGLLAPGGHVVWAALYGGALAAAKGADKLRPKYFFDKWFLMYFAIAFVLHFTWNLEFGIFAIPIFFDVKYIILIAVAWFFLLKIIKVGVTECMNIPQVAPAQAQQPGPQPQAPVGAPGGVPWAPPVINAGPVQPMAVSQNLSLRGLSGMYNGSTFSASQGRLVIGRDSGRANIVYPPNTPGISSVHCEVRFENGMYVLIDNNSSNGTFLADGTRLIPGQPVPIARKAGFYLATRENMFEIM